MLIIIILVSLCFSKGFLQTWEGVLVVPCKMGLEAMAKCFSQMWWDWGWINVFCEYEFLTNCRNSWVVDICFDWEPGLNARALPRSSSVTEEVASPKKLWESLVKQRGIALVEQHITESHCKIHPTSLLPICFARKGAGGWGWNCSHLCCSPSSFVCRWKICAGSSCCNLLPGLGLPKGARK